MQLMKDNRGKGKISGDGQRAFDLEPNEELFIESSDVDVLSIQRKSQPCFEYISI